jgi:hypothetical protein
VTESKQPGQRVEGESEPLLPTRTACIGQQGTLSVAILKSWGLAAPVHQSLQRLSPEQWKEFGRRLCCKVKKKVPIHVYMDFEFAIATLQGLNAETGASGWEKRR